MSKFNKLFTLAQKHTKAGKATINYKSEGEGTLTLKMTGLPKSYDAAGLIAHAGAVGASLSGKKELTAGVSGGIGGLMDGASAKEFAKTMIEDGDETEAAAPAPVNRLNGKPAPATV